MRLKELQFYIQSANINFLIGSGSSRPYLATLGSIERWLTKLAEDRESLGEDLYKTVEASIYKAFFEKVMYPNDYLNLTKLDCKATVDNYKNFLTIWNSLLNKRHSRILNKQINLFTTNVDLLIEKSAQGMGIELNDGFKGSVQPVFDESNFMRSVSQTSLHYQHISEIPSFNLLKVHGSLNWSTKNNRIESDSLILFRINEALKKIPVDQFTSVDYIDPVDSITKEKSYDQLIEDAKNLLVLDTSIYDSFLDEYHKLIIVNPTKRKFSETVLEYHFYELMRIYSNALEKENSILFVAGFSFADEHLAKITKRAADSNPTLKIVVFAFSDDEEETFKKNLGISETCVNNNISILTPSELKEANASDNDCKDLLSRIDHFDMKAINEVFEYIDNNIHSCYE